MDAFELQEFPISEPELNVHILRKGKLFAFFGTVTVYKDCRFQKKATWMTRK